MYLLVYMLPLIIDNEVMLNCPYWKTMQIFFVACSLMYSTCLTINTIAFLRLYIEEYLDSIRKLYKEPLS